MFKLISILFLSICIIGCDGSDSSEPALSGVEFINKISGKWEVTCRPVSPNAENWTETRDINPTQILQEGIAAVAGTCPTEAQNDGAYSWVKNINSLSPETTAQGKQAYRLQYELNGEVYEDLLYEEGGYLYVGYSDENGGNLMLDLDSPYQRTAE